MTLLEQVEQELRMCVREANPAEPHMERMASLFQQIAGWMKTALTLLGKARVYVSCDIYNEPPYGPEARALYEEMGHFGAEWPPPDVRWKQGVEDSIRIVEDRIHFLARMGPAPGVVQVLEEVQIQLKAMLGRGKYSSTSELMENKDDKSDR